MGTCISSHAQRSKVTKVTQIEMLALHKDGYFSSIYITYANTSYMQYINDFLMLYINICDCRKERKNVK